MIMIKTALDIVITSNDDARSHNMRMILRYREMKYRKMARFVMDL